LAQREDTDQLFTALAEQLKTPLLQIVRLSEAAKDNTLSRISVISEQALRLVDAYVQSQTHNQTELLLEPVVSGAILYDVATDLQGFAKQWDFTLEIDQQGRGVPVMAHRESLRAMMTLLGASLIEANGELENAPRHIVLGTHRSARGTVVGAFSSHVEVSQRALQLTRSLHGRAAQAAPSLGMPGAAGLAIADYLGKQMSAPLKAYRHRSLTGIGSMFGPSMQLQLV
jgi:hypothetical protein